MLHQRRLVLSVMIWLGISMGFVWASGPIGPSQLKNDQGGLLFSTYLGNGLLHFSNSVAVDARGNTYVAGTTSSRTFPTTPGAFQVTYDDDSANESDGFVTKFAPDGSLVYSTLLGGSQSDQVVAIAVDESGDAYVTGITYSQSFPITPQALRSEIGNFGGVFLAKLNPAGTQLVYSTFLESSDGFSRLIPEAITVDKAGSVYLAGESSVPRHASGAFQIGPGGGDYEAFLMRINLSGTAIDFYTYVGGRGNDHAAAIVLDSSASVYIAGFTTSTDFPTTPGAFKTKHRDALAAEPFVAKLTEFGSGLVYSTLLGGTGDGTVSGIAVDSIGRAYCTGATSATDFPTTAGAFQRGYGGGLSDVFVTRLNVDGSAVDFSTYLGSAGEDSCAGLSIDAAGNVYLAGTTASNSFPVTNSLQRSNATGLAFISLDAGTSWAAAQNRLLTDGIRSLVIDPKNTSNLYAATNRGVFRTTDRGNTWRPNEGSAELDVRSLTIDPITSSVLYAVVFTSSRDETGSVLKTTDSGDTWSVTSQSSGALCIAIDPANPKVVYAGGKDNKGGGIYKSSDGGETWRFEPATLGPQSVGSVLDHIRIDPNHTTTIYGAYGVRFGNFVIGSEERDAIVQSTDGGGSWSQLGLGPVTVRSIELDPINSSTIYVASTGTGMLKSTNAGASWRQINEGLTSLDVVSVAIDPSQPAVVYAGGAGLFKSTNGGLSWVGSGLDGKVNLIAVDAKNPSTVYATSPLRSDAFVAKLSVGGSSLVYSTYIGGRGDDLALGVAVDREGAVSMAGLTSSSDFPTAGVFRGHQDSNIFTSRIGPTALVAKPRVIDARISGKNLVVFGENFSDSAVVLLNGEVQKTSNSGGSPTTILIGKKTGKRIGRLQNATIEVRNFDGGQSAPFGFVRSVN